MYCPAGLALLGELAKVVSVSSARFSAAVAMGDADGGGLRVTVQGTPGEKVELAFVVSAFTSPTIRICPMQIQPSGEATATIQPAGSVAGDCTG